MKKLLLLVLCLSFLLCAACGTTTEPLTPVEEAAPAEIPTEEASGTNTLLTDSSASDIDPATPPASMTDTETYDTTLYDTALSYVGCPVEELFDAIGDPAETQYASSCAEENAEDGMLFYDGFYVWSLRTEDGEIVYDVYLDD